MLWWWEGQRGVCGLSGLSVCMYVCMFVGVGGGVQGGWTEGSGEACQVLMGRRLLVRTPEVAKDAPRLLLACGL